MDDLGFAQRRRLLAAPFGLAGAGLLSLLADEAAAAPDAPAGPAKPELEERTFDLQPKAPHFAPKAKAMISLFMIGGPSHLDLFDPKPKLKELDGKPFPGKVEYDNPAQASTKVLGPAWRFHRRGRCGMELSELLPCLGEVADDILLMRGMHTAVNNHVPSLRALNTGGQQAGRAALGAWLTYGLGSVTQELPAFVAMTHPHGGPLIESENWHQGALPSLYQGTVTRAAEPRILNLDAPSRLKGEPQRRQLELLRRLNARHQADRPGETDLAARMASYELAARMQLAAKEAFDISKESPATRRLYGVDEAPTRDYGTRCLIARRLVERGVRFVQLWNVGQSWDHHSGILGELPARCREVDRPAMALVSDLKARGLLASTIVHWGGEMGRLPVIQNDGDRAKLGRDHNTFGFSQWVAGGGFKAGHVHGATDEFGHHAVAGKVNPQDWLATVLHLFGLDLAKLAHKRGFQDVTVTDGRAGKPVRELLAG